MMSNEDDYFLLQMNFSISDIHYQLEFSSDMEEERPVITLKSGQRGVNLNRTEDIHGIPVFSLTGQGLLEDHGEEELRDFVTRCKEQAGGAGEGVEIIFEGETIAAEQFLDIFENLFDDFDLAQ